MKTLAIVTILFFSLQTNIPFKQNHEFDVKLAFEFKQRPQTEDTKKVNFTETRGEYEKRHSTTPLPYLYCILSVPKAGSEEVRLKVLKSKETVVSNKKIDGPISVKIDLGFTDDIKDRVAEYEYTFLFLNKEKKPLSQVIILFNEDGTYMVNGEKRGKI